MSCDPSYLSPMLVFDPDPVTEKMINRSGKRCGIYALLCGIEPLLAAIVNGLTLGLSLGSLDSPHGDLFAVLTIILNLFILPCIAGGIVFGLIGRETEGRFYATIGLWLSLLYCGLLFLLFVVIFASFIIAVMFAGGAGMSGSSGGRCC